MKRIVALVLTLVMILTAVSALAVGSKGLGDLVQAETKVVKTNPVTNEEEEVETEATVTVEKAEDKAATAGKASAKSKLMAAMEEAVNEAVEEVQKEVEETAAEETAKEIAEKTEEAVNEAIINVLPEKAQEALKAAAAKNEKLNVEDLTTINETATLQLSGDDLEKGGNLQEGETLAITVSFPTVFPEDSELILLIGILNEDHTEYTDFLAMDGKVVDGKVQFNLEADDIAAIGYSAFDVFVLE